MTLDLVAASRLIREMGDALVGSAGRQRRRLEVVRDLCLQWATEWKALADRARTGEAGWVLAIPREPLDTAHPLPPKPASYTVVATDGSQIEPDRHGPATCYLINLGWAVIQYGDEPFASLGSRPLLGYRPEDLYIGDGARQVPVQGTRLDARRGLEEMRRLVELAAGTYQEPVLALSDGTLLLWVGEEAGPDFVQRHFTAGYLALLDAIRAHGVPLAGYVSRPRACDVVGLLRLASCPEDPRRCLRCADASVDEPCPLLRGLPDRVLFEQLLAPGERSALFESGSRVQRDYGEHGLCFFYLRVDENEVARVEVPRWVAEDPASLARVHALVVDQCSRGQGYPVALARAHEKAVVTGGDRQRFAELLAGAWAARDLEIAFSAKQMAKRRRAV